ncbi:MAG: hypothetical protein AAFX05_09505 [Planctomycetota bacterium]
MQCAQAAAATILTLVSGALGQFEMLTFSEVPTGTVIDGISVGNITLGYTPPAVIPPGLPVTAVTYLNPPPRIDSRTVMAPPGGVLTVTYADAIEPVFGGGLTFGAEAGRMAYASVKLYDIYGLLVGVDTTYVLGGGGNTASVRFASYDFQCAPGNSSAEVRLGTLGAPSFVMLDSVTSEIDADPLPPLGDYDNDGIPECATSWWGFTGLPGEGVQLSAADLNRMWTAEDLVSPTAVEAPERSVTRSANHRLITFDGIAPGTPVDGAVIANVAFSFDEGSPPGDVPQTAVVEDRIDIPQFGFEMPNLEGPATGVLRLDFPRPIESIGMRAASFTVPMSAFELLLYDAQDALVGYRQFGPFTVSLPNIAALSIDQTPLSAPASYAVMRFDAAGGPEVFVLDRIEFTLIPTPCVGDVSDDGDVTLVDFTVLAANFGATGGAQRFQGDLDGDGSVALSDFTILANDFGCLLVE